MLNMVNLGLGVGRNGRGLCGSATLPVLGKSTYAVTVGNYVLIPCWVLVRCVGCSKSKQGL